LSYPVGVRIRFVDGHGLEGTGTVEGHTTWNYFPGQICYLIRGMTIPHSRVLGVEAQKDKWQD
jgi:hypothetical protein